MNNINLNFSNFFVGENINKSTYKINVHAGGEKNLNNEDNMLSFLIGFCLGGLSVILVVKYIL